MRTNIILTAAVLFIASLFTSCASDLFDGNASKKVTLSGSMGELTEASGTRMSHDATSLIGQFKWQTGDQIDVWNAAGVYIGTMSLSDGNDKNAGIFSGTVSGTSDLTPKYVTYPTSSSTLTPGTSNVTTISSVPTGQEGDLSAHPLSDLTSARHYILAQAEVNDGRFVLNHRFAYIYMDLTLNPSVISHYTHAYITGTSVASTSYSMNPATGALTPTGAKAGLNVWGNPSIMPIPAGASMDRLGLYVENGNVLWATTAAAQLVSNTTGGCIYRYTGTLGTDTYTFTIPQTTFNIPAGGGNVNTLSAAGATVTSTLGSNSQAWVIDELSMSPITDALHTGSTVNNTSGVVSGYSPYNENGTNGQVLSILVNANTSTSSRTIYVRLRQIGSNNTIPLTIVQAGQTVTSTSINIKATYSSATGTGDMDFSNFLPYHEYTITLQIGNTTVNTYHKAANGIWTNTSNGPFTIAAGTSYRYPTIYANTTTELHLTDMLNITPPSTKNSIISLFYNTAYDAILKGFIITDNTTGNTTGQKNATSSYSNSITL